MEMPTTIDIELLELLEHIKGQVDCAQPRRWGDYPLMVTPKHIVEITGWSRTFTYEQLRPYGRLAHLAQRWGRGFLVSRDALRRLLEGEEVE